MRIRKHSSLTTVLLLLFVGMAFAATGFYMLSENQKLSKNGITSPARVINLKEESDQEGILFRPEIEFTTSDGKFVRAFLNTASNPPAYSVGEGIEIIYSKDMPSIVMVNSNFQNFWFPIWFVILGLIIFMVGIMLIFKRKL